MLALNEIGSYRKYADFGSVEIGEVGRQTQCIVAVRGMTMIILHAFYRLLGLVTSLVYILELLSSLQETLWIIANPRCDIFDGTVLSGAVLAPMVKDLHLRKPIV